MLTSIAIKETFNKKLGEGMWNHMKAKLPLFIYLLFGIPTEEGYGIQNQELALYITLHFKAFSLQGRWRSQLSNCSDRTVQTVHEVSLQ